MGEGKTVERDDAAADDADQRALPHEADLKASGQTSRDGRPLTSRLTHERLP